MTKRILAPALMTLVLISLLVQLPSMAFDRKDALEWFDPIMDVRRLISDLYVEDIDEDRLLQMQRAAIDGMIKDLDDPYTIFIPRKDRDEFEKTMGGTYVGIGAEVRKIDGWLTIISPMAKSPAIKAGIKAGDQIRSIDPDGPDGPLGFVTTEEEASDGSIGRLMGEPSSKVSVRVRHEGMEEDEYEELLVVRGRINVDTVEGVHRVGEGWNYYIDPVDKIAYLRLTQFTGTSFEEMFTVTRQLIKDGMKGMVFDMRWNPGGRMDAAIRIADLFVPTGRIVSMKGRAVQEAAWDAHRRGTMPDFPMMVLVNGSSASASEIVAGALSDNDRAKVLGTRSFGKGKVQDVKHLDSDAGQLKITTAYYYLPSGRNLQRLPESTEWGVDPSGGYFIPLTNTEQLALLNVQRELDIIRDGDHEGEWDNPEWIDEKMQDPQLIAAVNAIRGKITEGEWAVTGQDQPDNFEVMNDLSAAEKNRESAMEYLEKLDERIEQLRAFAPLNDDDEEGDANAEDLANATPILPVDHPLKGGVVIVHDADGNVVRTFTIDNRDDLAAALDDANLTPVGEDDTDASEQ